MGLTNEGMVQNAKASLEKYIQDSLAITEGLKVDYEGKIGEPFDEKEWIAESILDFPIQEHLRSVGDGQKGNRASILVNLNIFVKKDNTRQTNRHYEIRDIIGDYLYIGKDIDLYDFQNSNFTTSLQKLRIREIITDRPIPNDNFWQYNYTVGIDWTQKWE